MINKKLPVVSLIFYILAGLILIFAIWAAVFSIEYISTMVAMGQIIASDNLFEITSFHMTNFGQYLIYAALLFGVGWIVQLFAAPVTVTLTEDEEDEDLEELWEVLETDFDAE